MTIQRPYIRQSVSYSKENINAWEKEIYDDSASITDKLRNKSWLISPMDGVAGKEVHHHKIKAYFNGPNPRIILAHSNMPQLDEVRSTSYYSLGPYTMTNGIEIDIPMPYGGRIYTWIFVEDIDGLDIQSIEHSYWRCPNDLHTYNGQEGPFFHKYLNGSMAYFIRYPNNYDSEKDDAYPLFISCAGSDTVGCDGSRGRNQVDPSWIILRHYRNEVNHPAFYVTIQSPNNCGFDPVSRPDLPYSPYHDAWYNGYGPMGYGSRGVLDLIKTLINNADYHIDTNRIYMGGFSGGGKLSFSLLQAGRDVFAAVAPTSAWPIGNAYQDIEKRFDWPSVKYRLRQEVSRSIHIPTLVGVGTKDNMIYGSRAFKNMVDELGGECRYQEYINDSHGAAPKTCFNNFDNVDWIFSKIKKPTPVDPYPNYNFTDNPASSASSKSSKSSSSSSKSSSESSREIYQHKFGPNPPNSIQSSGSGDHLWNNVQYVQNSDLNKAWSGPLSFEESSYNLRATNFGFNIPNNHTIVGIKFEIQRSAEFSSALDLESRALKGGSVVGNVLWGGRWPQSEEYSISGDYQDLHGTTWTPTDINNSDFGFQVSAICDGKDTKIFVNHMRISVYTTSPSSSLSSKSSSSSSSKSSSRSSVSSSSSSSSSSSLSSSSSSSMDHIPGDITGDDFVGIEDLSKVLTAWNKRRGQQGYDVDADLDKDGFIGIADLNVILVNWGKKK